jgi:hypothetical protein
MTIEVNIGLNDTEVLRKIEILDYKINGGSPAWSSHWENGLDMPPEGATIEDMDAVWEDTQKTLTCEEYNAHAEAIEDAIMEGL